MHAYTDLLELIHFNIKDKFIYFQICGRCPATGMFSFVSVLFVCCCVVVLKQILISVVVVFCFVLFCFVGVHINAKLNKYLF